MNNKTLIETTKSSELIYDGKILKFCVDKVTLPDGEQASREYCKHNGGVCVVAITDNCEVLCVNQYRYPHHKITTEIPAGKLNSKDENHKDAVLRELQEETGATCKKLTYLGELYPTPAILDEVIYMYMAQELSFGKDNPDFDEFLECVKIPLDTLVDKICTGEVPDAKTQAAVLRAWKIIKNI